MSETAETAVVCRGCEWVGTVAGCDRWTLRGVTLFLLCPVCESVIEDEDEIDPLAAKFEPGELESILDLSTWTETRGFGSVDAIICPHCEWHHTADATPVGVFVASYQDCARCGLPFKVRRTKSPLGPAWLTEAST